jgi:hypothetical protein
MPPNLNEPSPAIAARPLRDTGATLLTLSGFAAAFGVASCCGLPFLLGTMGDRLRLAVRHRLPGRSTQGLTTRSRGHLPCGRCRAVLAPTGGC